MKTDKNIFVAFLLNLGFSILELFGGIYTGSIAIVSDAIHDAGDAAGIGLAYILEKKSKMPPNETYTYGYTRYSVFGSIITNGILLAGSVFVVYNAIQRICSPVTIHYNGMLLFAIIGVCVNFFAALFTHGKDSLNQKAVHLHMIEDVLGWAVVLFGALLMKYTDITLLDPLMSIGIAVFILTNAMKNMREALDILLEKTPYDVNIHKIKDNLKKIPGILDVHHMHIWSMDGQNHFATMHIVADGNTSEIKKKVRNELHGHGITHVTLETEAESEHCPNQLCNTEVKPRKKHHHH